MLCEYYGLEDKFFICGIRMIICSIRIYHEDFLMPGIIPSFAYSRKQMRQSPKSRINARLRPQRKQRRTIRVENFGFLRARAVVDVLAIK